MYDIFNPTHIKIEHKNLEKKNNDNWYDHKPTYLVLARPSQYFYGNSWLIFFLVIYVHSIS